MADEDTAPDVVETPELQAEMAAALAEVAKMQAEAEPEPEAAQAQPDPAAAAPVAEPAKAAPEPKDDRRLSLILKREAEAKRAVAEARAEREALAREREAFNAERTAKAKPAAEPANDDDFEERLLAKLGNDAPKDLVDRVAAARRVRAQEQRLEQIEKRIAEREAEAQRRADETEESQRLDRARSFLRDEVIPKFGDDIAGVRILASDPEFANGVLSPGIQRYRQLHAEQGEATPEAAFRPMHQTLVRMVRKLASDPAFAREVGIQLVQAPAAEKNKPTIADEKKPAQPPKTISNVQHVTSTRLPAPGSMDEEYQAALDYVRELQRAETS